MSGFEFTVEQRQVPGQRQHCWVAVDAASGDVIDLPRGGTGTLLGRYPEIATWLALKGTPVTLDFSRARGDTFDADHNRSLYTWTFNTGGGIVVKDIPRVEASLTVQI